MPGELSHRRDRDLVFGVAVTEALVDRQQRPHDAGDR
ncbi:aromatic ring hydroxylase [Microbacterium invictum]|uniref:Aromatic ring hydroxylase n=1 Tax=Microbacterium invictum TaxID=515415 RepID=A0AA40VMP5_9MICO|nr:aromatic ring hydroxylase [Microbacterium invictum]